MLVEVAAQELLLVERLVAAEELETLQLVEQVLLELMDEVAEAEPVIMAATVETVL